MGLDVDLHTEYEQQPVGAIQCPASRGHAVMFCRSSRTKVVRVSRMYSSVLLFFFELSSVLL